MQSKEEIEKWYSKEDPWSYKTTQDDLDRKKIIINFLDGYIYEKVLDLGCGEGFITTNLPAKEIHGLEISDTASARFPNNIKRVLAPEGKYDLVTTMGTMYKQYNHAEIYEWIKSSATKHILIAGIDSWLLPYDYGKLLKEKKYKYRQFEQILQLYEVQ